MIDRIKVFMKSYNLSAAELSEKLEVQRSGISHLLSGRNNPSLSFIMKLLEIYPELNPDWILFNRGTMLRGGQTTIYQFENDGVELEEVVEKEPIKDNEPSLFDSIEENNVSELASVEEEKTKNLFSEPEIEIKEQTIDIQPITEIPAEKPQPIEVVETINQESQSQQELQTQTQTQVQTPQKPDSEVQFEKKQIEKKDGQLETVVLLYDDGTFKEYRSR